MSIFNHIYKILTEVQRVSEIIEHAVEINENN